MGLSYRADIDGLRAIAVSAVIANHLPAKYLPSGFLGVDVFFVISGFVILGATLNNQHASLAAFYRYFCSRRIKRLLPALLACVGITSLMVLAVDPFPRDSILTGVTALFGVSNFYLYSQNVDYFAASIELNAFQHTWSLGVEEQFYVVFPLVVWLFYSARKSRSIRALGSVIAITAVASISAYAVKHQSLSSEVYFLTHFRVWELAAGALAYLAYQSSSVARYQKLISAGAVLALVGLIACFFTNPDHASQARVICVILTVLLLLNRQRDYTNSVLSLTPLVYTGKLSYSLYLWHWPILYVGIFLLPPELRQTYVYVPLMALFAALSYHLVEQPLRYRDWVAGDGKNIALGLLSSAVLAAVILGAATFSRQYSNPVTELRYPPAFVPIIPSQKPYNPTCVVDGKQRKLMDNTFNLCTVEPRKGSGMPTIWVLGDSHAGHLQAMLYGLHRSLGIGVHLIETPGYAFPFSSNKYLHERHEIYEEILKRSRDRDIFLISRSYIKPQTGLVREDVRDWIEKVDALAKELLQRNKNVIVFAPPPIFSFEDIRLCDIEAEHLCAAGRKNLEEVISPVLKGLRKVEYANPNLNVFDPFPFLCEASASVCTPNNEQSFLYRDNSHLNSEGAGKLIRPFSRYLRQQGLL